MPRPRLDEPSEKLKKQMYNMYKAIFNSSFSERKKINLMTAIHGWEPWSWRVVGITPAAVASVVNEKGRSKCAKDLVRDHYFKGRTDNYREMLSEVISFENWWTTFWKNDRVILMTRKEHSKRKNDSFVGLTLEYFKIDWKNGLFSSGKVAGFLFAKKYEGDFIINNFAHRIYKIDQATIGIKNER